MKILLFNFEFFCYEILLDHGELFYKKERQFNRKRLVYYYGLMKEDCMFEFLLKYRLMKYFNIFQSNFKGLDSNGVL